MSPDAGGPQPDAEVDPVRMGIATGEAEQRGEDYFGPVLNLTARVMDAGHGGQILMASSTAGLVSGVELADLGSRSLRDLLGPVQIFQVHAEGLRSEFPALRTVDVVPGWFRGGVWLVELAAVSDGAGVDAALACC